MATSTTALRTQFFDYVFGHEQGYVCIATQHPGDRSSFRQHFFRWPFEKVDLATLIAQAEKRDNVWFCVNMLTKAERRKENCQPTNLVWADLDTCKPDNVEPAPQCIIESSPNRFQALWRLNQYVDPYQAETYSKKIAYKFNGNGVDPSGWDLTQLLLVPFTTNFKYDDEPVVKLQQALETPLSVELFELIEAPAAMPQEDISLAGLPELSELPEPRNVIYKYWPTLQKTPFLNLFETEPPEDWSRHLWKLVNICLESGMTTVETFAVAMHAKCNKYERDGRPVIYLWREVLKADANHSRLTLVSASFTPLMMPTLLSDEEMKSLPITIVDDYRTWASNSTDAIVRYHDLACFMVLSSLMAAGLKLTTTYGDMIPNIWGLILGDSTLTRKTTSMRMAIDFIAEIDRDLILATDGSAEGLLTGLSLRPSRVSMFYKDEVSGFMDSIAKKDYLAGMPETMTQLYDVPSIYNRRLRKEVITIVSPVFIFFGGGIRDKMYSLVTEEQILSGFMPRFLVVGGETDLKRLRRTGPGTQEGSFQREQLKSRFCDLYEIYHRTENITIAGQETSIQAVTTVELTEEAWERYGDIEEKLVEVANESPLSMLALPTFERLSRSLLKMAMLLAASRQMPQDGVVTCGLSDILGAAYYIQDWGRYTVDLLINSGIGTTQRVIDKTLKQIEHQPGITRSEIMRGSHFTRRVMDEIQVTLEDRQQIRVEKFGRGQRYWPLN